MNASKRTIVVTGATGSQGGAVLRHLQGSQLQILAVTRNPEKPEAKKLQSSNVEVVEADLNERSSLDRLFEEVYGVFSVQQFWEHGYEAEVMQGKNVADAAKRSGVKHLIYSSVGGAERDTGISHFDSKYEIEKHIRKSGLPCTILRPVFFMENFKKFSPPKVVDGVYEFSLPLPPNQKLQMIAVDDIGAFAAMAFHNPQQFLDKELEIAGDELNMQEIADTFSRVTGKEARFVQQPMEQVRSFSEDAAVMYEWFIREGYKADIPALRKLHPGLQSFEQWLTNQKW